MRSYFYTAYDVQGVKVDGELDAPSLERAKKLLEDQELMVVTVSESELSTPDSMFSRRHVSSKEMEYLTSELSLLLNSGVTIDKGLSVIKRNSTSAPQAKLIGALHDNVRRGMSLSDAMSSEGTVFSQLYVNLVRLGESSGTLPEVFARLSEDIKFQSALRQKIIQALIYPSVILLVCVICILFIFNYIVPQMSGLFEGLPEIPIYTAILLSVSDWFVDYQWYLMAAIGFSTLFITALLRTPVGSLKAYEIFMKLPGLSQVLILVERVRFNNAIALMLQSGILIDKCLELAVGSVKNPSLQQGLVAAKDRVKKGDSLAKALASSPLYTDFSISLIEVGEESGQLFPVFSEIGGRSRDEFEGWVLRFTSLLEPLLILLMGGIVGGVVVVMLLSIVSVNEIGI